jgi:hypothetical protein
MAKRLSRFRRLAKLAADSTRAARREKSLANGADDAKLQQGRVRSPLNTQFSIGYHAPKSVVPSPENMSVRSEGLTGKVQRGQFKFKRPEPSRAPPAGTNRKPRLRDWRGMKP